MTYHKRILGMALSFLLAWGANTWAAGKHKSGGHGKASPKSSTQNHGTPGSAGATEGTSPKAGGGRPETRAGNAQPALRESIRQESRIEFDERLLRGQSAAGVIYLFQRTPSDWKSIVEVPESFQARTVRLVAPSAERK